MVRNKIEAIGAVLTCGLFSKFLRSESFYCLENCNYKIHLFLILLHLFVILILSGICLARLTIISRHKMKPQLRMLVVAVKYRCNNSRKCLSKSSFACAWYQMWKLSNMVKDEFLSMWKGLALEGLWADLFLCLSIEVSCCMCLCLQPFCCWIWLPILLPFTSPFLATLSETSVQS